LGTIDDKGEKEKNQRFSVKLKLSSKTSWKFKKHPNQHLKFKNLNIFNILLDIISHHNLCWCVCV